MTTATLATSTNKRHSKRCKHCSKVFTTTSAVKKFCSIPCSKLATKQKRQVNYTANATDSAFFHLLASECNRAGTLQVLSGHTVESLIELYTLYKYWLRANQYGSVSDFALSHISPVAGNRTVGRFHAFNLVVAPTHMNRSHSNKHFGHGLSVSRASLQDRHAVDKHEPRKTTVARIIRFLGKDIVSEFAKIAKLQPTGRHKVMSWLMDHLDATIPEHAAYLERLHTLSTKALTQLKASVQGKEPTTPYRAPVKEAQALEVFTHELSRLSAIRPELKPLATFILECSQRITPQELLVIDLAFFRALFDVLHGKELADVADDLAPALATLQAFAGLSEDIPVVSISVVSAPIPAVTAPKVLMRFQSFADEVDYDMHGDALNDAPVMLQSRPEPVCDDPVPW